MGATFWRISAAGPVGVGRATRRSARNARYLARSKPVPRDRRQREPAPCACGTYSCQNPPSSGAARRDSLGDISPYRAPIDAGLTVVVMLVSRKSGRYSTVNGC